MKKSSVSCTQRSTYSQILYHALERWTRTHSPTLHGRKDWRGSKSSPEYRILDKRRRTDGIRVEYLPRIHHSAACPWSPRVTVKIERRTRNFHWTDYLHVERRRNGICWRIVKCMLSNCSEMLVLGTYWKTWYSMVSEQTCTIDYKMDQSLWQTPESIDFFNFIVHVNTNKVVMWETLPNNAD